MNKPQKSKYCKQFCEKVYLPDKERVELEFSKKKKMKYIPIKFLMKKSKTRSLGKMLKRMYLKSCNDIYCQEKCNGKKWLSSFTI